MINRFDSAGIGFLSGLIFATTLFVSTNILSEENYTAWIKDNSQTLYLQSKNCQENNGKHYYEIRTSKEEVFDEFDRNRPFMEFTLKQTISSPMEFINHESK